MGFSVPHGIGGRKSVAGRSDGVEGVLDHARRDAELERLRVIGFVLNLALFAIVPIYLLFPWTLRREGN